MKVFHTENGKEAVYVQMQDIMYLSNETDMPIPATIFEKVFTGVTIVTDANRFEFVRFDEEHEIKFFRELEFIIDFDQYKGLSDEQLEAEAQKLVVKANEIAEKWNGMKEEEREENSSLFDEHRNLGYMINFLSEIYAVKHGKRVMPFPEFVQMREEPKKPEKLKKSIFSFFKRKKDVK